MNDGISFNEACEVSPGALTSEQYTNCPGQETTVSTYPYIGVVIFLVVIVITVVLVAVLRRKNNLF